jgi:hypothetical protein
MIHTLPSVLHKAAINIFCDNMRIGVNSSGPTNYEVVESCGYRNNFAFHKMRGHWLVQKVTLGSKEGLRSVRLFSISSFPHHKSFIGMETEIKKYR